MLCDNGKKYWVCCLKEQKPLTQPKQWSEKVRQRNLILRLEFGFKQ